jgi:hypothetical protein
MNDSIVIAAVISGIFSFLVALLTSVLTSWVYWRQAKADLDKLYKSRFNEQKWKAYLDFVEMQSRATNVMKPESAEVKASLLLVASDEVIGAYNKYVSLSFQEDKLEERHEKVAQMIAAMRKDLGYGSEISSRDLWTMFESIYEVSAG